jgi:serine/threonine-protein kinase RsbW
VADDNLTIRLLGPDEGRVVGQAITAAYGDSYDAAWVYDEAEVAARLADGRLVSCVAEDADGALLAHAGLTRTEADEHVAEAGQAVTLPAARGHHLFTRVKRHLADWARAEGLFGVFSEATTAHPYSEEANVDLGARETGFLIGWIPATVANDAAEGDRAGRISAALFYLKTNDAHDRPVHAPPRHHDVVGEIIAGSGLRGRLVDHPHDARVPATSDVHELVRDDHNLAVLTVTRPGDDLGSVVAERCQRLFDRGLDAVYVDLPLADPATAHTGEDLSDLGFGFAGVFPNQRVDGDVLRLQRLDDVTIAFADIVTASDHGRDLLAYVVADLSR